MTIKAILTDIEGTTSSIAFVHEVLFPYAHTALPEFVRSRQHDDVIAALLEEVRAETDEHDADIERVIAILLDWIEADRKVTALKTLQGHIWNSGYASGDFTGHIYADAASNLRKWQDDGIALYVYSSGSIGAQKLLFGHSDFGDLRPLFQGYFDTQVGNKKEPDSYRNIVRELDITAEQILFLSDVVEELDAAALAGMQTMQLIRDTTVVPGSHRTAGDFDAVDISL